MRKFATVAAFLALAAVLLPGLASAQMREFKGKVDSINARELIVDNRMGDKLRFKPAKDVTVEGEKTDIKKLKKNDWVIVSWKMMDTPRVAYKIVVLPEQKEPGEDVKE
jgi:hypothetical protein